MKTIYYFIILLILSANLMRPQCVESINTDTTKHTQYRRGIALPEGYQSYDGRYAGKNLSEEKRRLFPLNQVNSGTGIWTELNPKVPRVDYMGIHFVNIDTGWACGDLGTIIKTTDGGLNWVTEETNTTTPLLKVRSPEGNGQLVIASGFDGLILRSTDRGEIWAMVTSNITGDLWGLQMINDTLGWACGNYNSLTKTTDGGLSWQRVFTPGYKGNYWWIAFMDEHYGFIAADGNVLRTTNGGLNWEIIQAGDGYPLFSIDVIDSLHIAAGGYGGTGYAAKNIYSSDGGNTWIDGGPTTTDPINCVKYINTDTGYITMSEVGIWKTFDRGQSWNLIEPNSPNLQGEYELQLFPQANIGYDVGSYLRIFKANGNFNVWNKLIINDDFSDVFFINEQKGFTLREGNYGMLFRTKNAGVSWDTIHNVPGGKCITFTDSLKGFIGTTTNKIYKSTDGGTTWYQTNGITNAIAKIFFINHDMGWATGDSKIFITTDTGENWIEQLSAPSSIGFQSIYFVDSLYGWTANSNGRPYKTVDGGNNWIQQTNLEIYQSRDVFFLNHQNGFLLESNKLYKTTDGGNTFNLIPDITGYSVAARFSNYGDSTLFITGYQTYRSIDGGEDWYQFPELDLVKINELNLLNSGSGFAVGDMGLILRYYDSTYIPVELTSFLSDVNDDDVILSWKTATETNNRGFEVERFNSESITQNSGTSRWERIGFVSGYGTTVNPKSYSFTDRNVPAGKCIYRLKQVDFDGSYEYSKEIEVYVNAPDEFSLEQNFPNPFNPKTKIKYSIPIGGFVKLVIYDMLGNEVRVLVNEKKQTGIHTVDFDGSSFSSGVYLYRLISGDFVVTKKLVLIK